MTIAVMRRPSLAHARRTRKDDVLDFICRFAAENCGATPSTRAIGQSLGLSQQRVQSLMLRLQTDGRLSFVNRYTYRVNDSLWEPPPDLAL